MANTYKTDMVVVSTTGSNVIFFTASADLIVRDVMIYAKGGVLTAAVLFDDKTTDDVVAKKTLTADETWRPFTAPLAMVSGHELKVNTSDTITILITYVEFD